jgi:aspartyl-tRNA(Asn)/glutamyl-tRNA(Gln) amidotransferase subunit A
VSTIIQGEASSIFEELISSGKVDQIADPKQAAGLKAAGELSAKDYLKAMRVRSLLQVAFRDFFYELDMVIAPTRTSVASGIDVALDAPRAAVPAERKRGISAHIPAGNLAGLPALSLPCGQVGGLPIGVSLMGRAFTENALLAVGQQFQQKTDWHKKRPQV